MEPIQKEKEELMKPGYYSTSIASKNSSVYKKRNRKKKLMNVICRERHAITIALHMPSDGFMYSGKKNKKNKLPHFLRSIGIVVWN